MGAHLERCESLARQVGPEVDRSALQYFFVRPSQPDRPLSRGEIAAAWRAWAAEAAAGRLPDRLHFYLHVPFCSHRCRYCVYYSVAPADPGRVAAWTRRVRAELPFWAEALDGAPLWTMYVGGGTPTVLEPAALRDLLALLGSGFRVRPGGERAFECNPLTATEDRVRAFEEAGFNRASFGLQTIDPRVLASMDRGYQTVERLRETFRVLQACRFRINVDLLQGLPGEGPDALRDSLSFLLDHGPGEVTVYSLSPSTPADVAARSRPRPPAAVAEDLAEVASRAGYSLDVREASVKLCRLYPDDVRDRLADEEIATGGLAHYDDVAALPSSLLAVGPTTRSHVYGHLRYTLDRHEPDAPFLPEGPGAVGRPVSRREEQSQSVVHDLARNHGVDPAGFQRLFGEGIEDVFGPALDEARAAAALVERDGRLFHAASDPVRRFAVEMLFLGPEAIAFLDEAIRVRPAVPDGGDVVSVRAGDVRFRAVLAAADAVPRPVRAAGGFAFYVPSSRDGHGDAAERAVVRLFSRLFDAVIARDHPGTVAALRDALLARGNGLRLAASEGSRLYGAVLQVAGDGPGPAGVSGIEAIGR